MFINALDDGDDRPDDDSEDLCPWCFCFPCECDEPPEAAGAQ